MNTSRLRSTFTALVFAVASTAASAAGWTSVNADASGNFSVTYEGGAVDTLNIQPVSTLVNPVMFFTPNLTPQNADNIATQIEDQFNLAAGTLNFVASCDVGGSCTGGGSSSGSTGTFTANTTTPFDYLAIHLGQGELFFHWSSGITQAILSGIDVHGVSNFRAYSAIPLPGAFVLFLSAIGFFGMLRRRFFGPAQNPAIA
ncbi:MAG TPA: hypothetical protein VLK85_01330 [Ramlibacter sp.]|nr:hypothetical protein [Ramlibacter sp.]